VKDYFHPTRVPYEESAFVSCEQVWIFHFYLIRPWT